jgi:hypothetical protein
MAHLGYKDQEEADRWERLTADKYDGRDIAPPRPTVVAVHRRGEDYVVTYSDGITSTGWRKADAELVARVHDIPVVAK